MAGTNAWTGIGPQGGSVYDLAFHPTEPSTMYAATSAGFYRSSNSGSSWQLTSSSGLGVYVRPTTLAVEGSRPDRVYIGSGFGNALRSEDRGATLRVTSGPFGLSFEYPDQQAVAAAADGSAIYYALDGQIYRSIDGGVSRELRGSLLASSVAFRLIVDPSNPQIVYATTSEGVERSTDGGANWNPIFLGDGASAIAIDPQDPDRIWLATGGTVRVSNDAGGTWQTVLSESAADLDIDPGNSQVVYAALFDQRLMRTMDGGVTWTVLPVPEIADDAIRGRQLALHPTDDTRLYLFGPTGVFTSTDSGATWLRSDEGIMATSPGVLSSTATSSGHFFFPVLGYGIAALRPGDASVDTVFQPSLPNAGGDLPGANAVLSLSTTLIAAFDNSSMALSSDFGATWTSPVAPPPYTLSLAAAENGARVYAATSGGIYRSDDLGDHWSRTSNGLPPASIISPIAVGADQTHLYVALSSSTGGRDGLYRSVDGGQNWAPTTLERFSIIALATHPTDARTLLAGSLEGAFKTTDGGATWQALRLRASGSSAPVSAVAFDPVNPDIIYVDTNYALGNGVLRSVDAGVTFQRIMPDYYPGVGATSLLVPPDQSHRVVAAVRGMGIMEISIEPDLQLTLQSQSGSATANSPVEFTITAANRGPFDATGVQVQAELPAGTSATSGTINGNACVVATNVVTCTVGVMRLDQTTEIRVRTTPTTQGSLVLNAAITGAQPDSIASNNSGSASVSISSAPPSNPGGGDAGGGGGGSGSGGGGGGGTFDITAILGLLSLGLLRRRRRLYE